MRLRLLTPVITIVFISSVFVVRAQEATSTTPHPPAFKMSGDIALLTVAVKPDKTSDFERVLGRLRSALRHSPDPKRQQQAAGWKVIKIEKPMPDGTIAYVHVISPVVKDADYSILQTIYDELPKEGPELYELYRGAFSQNLSLAAGSIVMDAGVATATQ